MKLGLNLAVFTDRSLERALDDALQLGIEGIELNAEAGDPFVDLEDLLAGGAARLRRVIESRGLEITAVGNHGEGQLVLGPHHADTDRIHRGTATEKIRYGMERLKMTARVAAELGAPTVIGFCGCEDWARWFPWPEPDGWSKMSPAFVERWGEILDEVRRCGVRFAHEPHPKQFAYDLETSLESVRLLDGRPEWGFNLDLANLDLANLALAGVDPAHFITELGDRIFHVHAKDLELVAHRVDRSGWQAHGPWGRRDRGFRFRVPGWGDVPWRRVLTELRLAGYDGVLSIEHEDPTFDRDDGVEQAVRFLRPLLAESPPPESPWW